MTSFERAMTGVISRVGETFEVSAVSHKGIFSVLSADGASALLTASEIGAAAMPLYVAVVAFDNAVGVGASVTYRGDTYTVLRALGFVGYRMLVMG